MPSLFSADTLERCHSSFRNRSILSISLTTLGFRSWFTVFSFYFFFSRESLFCVFELIVVLFSRLPLNSLRRGGCPFFSVFQIDEVEVRVALSPLILFRLGMARP